MSAAISMEEFDSLHQPRSPQTLPPFNLATKRIDLTQVFTVTPAPLDFVMPGFLLGTVGALVAPGSTGKSFWALEAAMAIAAQGAGDLLALRPGGGGRVVFLSLEDPALIVQNRVHTIGKKLAEPARAAIAANLDVLDLYGERINLMNPDTVEAIVNYCKGARLIVVDTLSRSHQMDENKNGEMALLMSVMDSIAKRTGASFLFLHHISKSSNKEGRGNEASASRGASVLVDNARFVGFLQVMTPAQAKELCIDEKTHWKYIRSGVSKVNYSTRIPEQWLEKGDGGVLAFIDLENANRGEAEVSADMVDLGALFGQTEGNADEEEIDF